MQITVSTQQKLRIEGADRLDPIEVFLDDIAPRQGRITINCYGQSWTAYWGGMGDRTIAEFILSCDEDYLANKLSNMRSSLPDYNGLNQAAKAELLSERRQYGISQEEARDLFERLSHSVERECEIDTDAMHSIFGDEWWHNIPHKPNPDYQYLCRIINATKDGIRQAQNLRLIEGVAESTAMEAHANG
ncbi:MAG: hypothetical protein AB1450_08140 [Pseudomonadota bacterium]